jgi:hypothetical protein
MSIPNSANGSSAFHRAVRWLNKPPAERKRRLLEKLRLLNGLPFKLGRARLADLYLSYLPDSYVHASAHLEFDSLLGKFTRRNRRINGGDIPRLWSLILNLKQVIAERVEGDFAELGVWRGNSAAVLAHFAAQSGREVFLFDTFEGFSNQDIRGVDAGVRLAFADTSLELVRSTIGEDSRVCRFVKGHFPESIEAGHRSTTYAAVSLDCDLYEPMRAGLEFFYPRMPRGGMLLVHDYSSSLWPGAKQAVDEFCKQTGELVILMPDKSGSALVRKSKVS